MKLEIFFIAFALFSSVSLVYSKCEPKSILELKRFKIDLDKPASERFQETASFFRENLIDWFSSEK
jgi:hypothetical protein